MGNKKYFDQIEADPLVEKKNDPQRFLRSRNDIRLKIRCFMSESNDLSRLIEILKKANTKVLRKEHRHLPSDNHELL